MNALPTVLVIDDETATLTMFRLFLTAYGYSVLTAENGEAGLELVRDHAPGIVFTDLKMPGMDGFEVLKQIKIATPQTEVIVITGHGDMDHVVRALNLEATDFINKPIGRSALDAALQRAEARLNDKRHNQASVETILNTDVGMISFRGTLGGQHKAPLMASFQQILDSGAAELVIRFDHHASVNGTGIALLTRLLRSARHAGLQVRIAGLSENFRTIFDMLGITRIAPCIEPSANHALKGSKTDGK
jgi:YesN/AraC family two-component response regulator